MHRPGRLPDRPKNLPLTSTNPDEIIDTDFLQHFPEIKKPV